jgi:oxygen-independent coproporphyrinogen-3 oxidase
VYAAHPLEVSRPDLMALVDKYDGRAPRYTSYPTAVQFKPEVDAAVYRGWLAALDPAEPVSLYAHIPFCSRLCWFCGCSTRAVNRHEPVSEYVALLVKEIGLMTPSLPGRLKAKAMHLGGGTPNMMSPADMDVLFAALRGAFDFDADAEVAAELDPASLTEDWVRAAASHGLNRASLGVQSLSPQVQAAVNRRESYEEVARCVGWLREAGVGSVNIDLMYGLPHQTTINMLETVERVASLRPERLALFGYAHVPWMKAHQQLIEDAALPGPIDRLDQSEAAADHLISQGYVRIGLDHFALPDDELAVALAEGRLHRNFQGYTTDDAGALLGFGASAIGVMPQGYVQNTAQELAWRAAVGKGELPTARGVAVTADDRFRGEIIERLMCDLRVDLAAVCARHGRPLSDLAGARARMADFAKDDLVRLEGAVVQVTELGRLLVRSVCAEFDAYFAPEGGRHSKAI